MREVFVAALAVGVLGSAVFLAIGCGRNGPSASATDEQSTVEPGNATAYALASKRLATVRSALATGRDPSMKCKSLVASVSPLRVERDAASQRLVGDVERLCGYDAPLAWAQTNLDGIGDGASTATSCAHVEEALDDLRRFGHEGEAPVQEIDASYRRLCRA